MIIRAWRNNTSIKILSEQWVIINSKYKNNMQCYKISANVYQSSTYYEVF